MKWETKSTSSFFSKSQCKLTKMSTGLACMGLFIKFFFFFFFFARRFNRCGRDGKGRAGIAKLLKPSSFAGPLLVLMGFLADIIGFSIVFHRFLWFTVGS